MSNEPRTTRVMFEGDDPVAEFWMAGETLVATYFDPVWEEELKAIGAYTAKGDAFPKDGRRFYDALEVAFANSSRIAVVDIAIE